MSRFKKALNENFANYKSFTSDAEIVRAAIAAEIDAINFYEQLAVKAKDKTLKTVLLDIAREEKVHIGEFEAVLEFLDPDFEKAEEEGEEEVEELKGDRI